MKKVLITGASRGIGRAIALELKSSYNLILHASTEESLAPVLRELDGKAEILSADFSDMDAVKNFCKGLKKMAGSNLYGVVNNAGVALDKPLLYQSLNDMELMLNINVKAPLLISKSALKLFLAKGEGCIVNMGSCVAQTGNAFQVVYSMTKAAMETMGKSVAKEMAAIDNSAKIRSVTVAPGFIETDMTTKLSEELKQKYLEMIPAAYFGKPEEVAKAIKFALSDEATYINGSTIAVNGGLV